MHLVEKGERIFSKLRSTADGGEIGVQQQRPPFRFSRQQKIRQVPFGFATGMDDHFRAAVQKLPRHFEADAPPGAGHDDIAIFE